MFRHDNEAVDAGVVFSARMFQCGDDQVAKWGSMEQDMAVIAGKGDEM